MTVDRFHDCTCGPGYLALNTQYHLKSCPVRAPEPDTTTVRKLVVELNQRTDQDLNSLVIDEGLNKSTIVNRAVQVYAEIAGNQAAGGSLILVRPDGTQERFIIT